MVVHITILISKLDSLSSEEFNTYWSVDHPKIWLGVKVVQDKLIKYSQFHVDRTTSDALATKGIPIASNDGGVEMWADTVEDLMSVFQDEEYNRVVVPDEEKFLKRSEAKMMLGHDEVKFDNRKKV